LWLGGVRILGFVLKENGLSMEFLVHPNLRPPAESNLTAFKFAPG